MSVVENFIGATFSPQSALLDWAAIHDLWARDLAAFTEKTDGAEVPYVHTEHGNTTQLAISASSAGYAAIREVLGGNRGDRQGRLDLCLISKNTVDLVEAKWVEFSVYDPLKHRIIADRLKDAVNQVRGYSNKLSRILTSGRTVRRVAVEYVTPFLENPKPFDERKLEDLLSYIKETCRPDMLSWVFPASTREFTYWGNRAYPGVIFLAKLVDMQEYEPS